MSRFNIRGIREDRNRLTRKYEAKLSVENRDMSLGEAGGARGTSGQPASSASSGVHHRPRAHCRLF